MSPAPEDPTRTAGVDPHRAVIERVIERGVGPVRVVVLVASMGLLLLVGAAGPSAAAPGLGPRGWAPGALSLELSSATVTATLWTAYVLGALAVGLALWRPPSRPVPRAWLIVLGFAVLVLLTAPFGSADHTNYAAYGRIAAQGGDPYVVPPVSWHGGTDPVTSAVEPPWTTTPSVYGPLATAVQAICSLLAGDNLRQTVWLWQVVVVASFIAVRVIMLELAETDRSRARVDVLWTFNPLVVGVLVFGAHVDVLATVGAVGALVLARRRPLLAGLAVGAAVSTKVTYGIVAVGLLWAWHAMPRPALWRRIGRVAVGALIVMVPLHVWAGPHVFRQLGNAGGTSSLATAWSVVVQALRHVLPEAAVTTVVLVLAAATMIAVAVVLARIMHADTATGVDWGAGVRQRQPADLRAAVPVAARATFVLTTAYVIAAPYSLPWYDGLTWALLPLVVPTAVDGVLLGRFAVMVLAYVPGRVVGMSADVESFTLGFRREWAPWAGWLTWAALILILRRESSSARGRRSDHETRRSGR